MAATGPGAALLLRFQTQELEKNAWSRAFVLL